MQCKDRLDLDVETRELVKKYVGNVNFYPLICESVKDLLAEHIGDIAYKVRQAVDAVDDKYIRSAIEWIETVEDKRLILPSFNIFFGDDFAITN